MPRPVTTLATMTMRPKCNARHELFWTCMPASSGRKGAGQISGWSSGPEPANMSRIFDALQRSGTEQSGIEYADMVSVATEVFERSTEQVPTASAGEFPSLAVSVVPTSRLVFLTEPESLAAEKFRFLGVRLRQLQQTRPLKKVLVTSAIPEEGKSMVSANLAGVLARRRKQKILLLEGDLRRPVLAQQFGLGHLAGLAEWLESDLHTPANIYHLEGPDFWFMPAGKPPGQSSGMDAVRAAVGIDGTARHPVRLDHRGLASSAPARGYQRLGANDGWNPAGGTGRHHRKDSFAAWPRDSEKVRPAGSCLEHLQRRQSPQLLSAVRRGAHRNKVQHSLIFV